MILRAIVIAAAVSGLAITAHASDVAPKPSQDDGDRAPMKGKRHVRRAPYRECCGEPYRFVYAEGWYGLKKVIAPVRRAGDGDQVQLPGGIWVRCEFSCEYTLRKQTLDFWKEHGADCIQASPCYPRSDSYVDGWGYRHGYLF